MIWCRWIVRIVGIPYLAALVLLLIGTFGLFGEERDSLAGVFLMPYWGIPDVDDRVRPLTDDHPLLLEDLRQMGRRVGADYAFIAVLAAEKPGP